MVYWSTSHLDALVSLKNRAQPAIHLELPFALIGSHPACNVQLAGVRAPRFSYLAIIIEDTVQVWPLCALAYSQWGDLPDGEKLRIGHAKIMLTAVPKECPTEQHAQADTKNSKTLNFDLETDSLVVQIGLLGKEYSFVIGRHVVIVGEDHPSTLRIRSAGLKKCGYAIIASQDGCWIIELCPQQTQTATDLVHAVKLDEPAVRVGDFSISVRRPSPDELSAIESPDTTAALIKVTARQFVRPASKPHSRTGSDKKKVATKSDRPVAEPDPLELTSDITNRLVSISRSRWSKQRLLKTTATITLALAAGVMLIWIFAEKLLPIIVNFEGHQ